MKWEWNERMEECKNWRMKEWNVKWQMMNWMEKLKMDEWNVEW
jgi:hypothetical protein